MQNPALAGREKMADKIELTGMVLTAMPVGDYDKRITILTTDRGKITAFVRGARRPKSQLVAASNPLVFGTFELVEGRTAYNLTKASVTNSFRELAADVDRVCMAFYFLEFAEYYCRENNDEKEMLKLLYQSMRALESEVFRPEFVRVIFEIKAMTINGEGPQVLSCMNCGEKANLNFFSVERGGSFCPACRKMVRTRSILDSTRYTMQYIVCTPVESLYTFDVSEEVLGELSSLMEAYMGHYVRHRFKSLEMMSDFEP